MLRLYNTLSRQEEAFAPARDNTVRMYACGLTVYARGHIGNFRTFVCVDVLRRTLKYLCGHNVDGVMNYTDVDDKTIAGSVKAGKPLREYTEEWVNAFRSDVELLGIEMPEHTPRATDDANMQAMCDMVMALERNGHTYNRDGSIYFKIGTLPEYGRLARLDQQSLHVGASVDLDEYSKDDARDFVLWKAAKPGEPTWECAGLPGRPGWHIECSAMALRLLDGAPIDIHAGGVDLIFPHHENEIAQAEGATKQTFSRFWVHVEHLFVENEKMSKSLGNVFTVRDILDKGYRASALRYLLLSVHYRKQLTFNFDVLAQADAALTRLADFLARLDTMTGAGERAEIATTLAAAQTEFRSMVASDLNVPGALGVMFDLLRELNAAMDAGRVGAADAARVRAVFEQFDQVLGVMALRRREDEQPPVPVAEIESLIAERREARRARQFGRADEIRRDLESRGIILEDSATGTRWKRKS